MDFNAWFEVFLGGRWYTFDARHNEPRIGRIVIARGRDATDVAMINSFGIHSVQRFDGRDRGDRGGADAADACLARAVRLTPGRGLNG